MAGDSGQSPFRLRILALVGVSMVLGTSGCFRSVMTASKLTPEMMAAPVQNAQTLNLSRFASHSVSNELIEPGDILKVTVGSGHSEDNTRTTPVRVMEDGIANVPLIPNVRLAGLELVAAEQLLRSEAVTRGIYKDPHVVVQMEKKRVHRITVLGGVNEPGPVEVPRSSSDLMGVIVAAGGLSEDAGTRVEVRRPSRQGYPGSSGPGAVERTATRPVSYDGSPVQHRQSQDFTIDLIVAAQSGQVVEPIRDGDVVVVEKRLPRPVHVIGLVTKAGQYEMPAGQDLYLLDALAMAGGVNSGVADKIFVIRRVPTKPEPVVVQISLAEAKHSGQENLRLAPGDVVSVEQTPTTVLLDAVRNFVRVGASASIF